MREGCLYTKEIHEEIVSRLSSGEPLEQICRDPRLPSSRTVSDWRAGNVKGIPESFGADIAHARDLGYDAIAGDARKVARGLEGFTTGDVARDKLVIDTDLKLLAKWDPRRYGDKLTQEIGGIGGGKLEFIVTRAGKQ